MSRKSCIGYCKWCGTYGHLSDGLCKKCYCKKYYREVTRPILMQGKKPGLSEESMAIYNEYKDGNITQSELARKYGKSRQRINALIKRIEGGK